MPKYRTNVPTTTISRDMVRLSQDTENIYETVMIIAKRANQIAAETKQELEAKLQEFTIFTDDAQEVFENQEQIELSRQYERLPKPTLIAAKEYEDGDLYEEVIPPRLPPPLSISTTMWQRIQTLWLLIVGVLMALFAFQDVAIFTLPEGIYCLLSNWSIYSGTDGTPQHSVWAIGALSILVSLGAFALIFLYQRRMLQMRLTVLLLCVILGELIYIAWVSWQFCSANGASFGIRFPLALPIICLPLLYLAARRMIYDETLIRASSRLR